jgi:hypothetical protein
LSSRIYLEALLQNAKFSNRRFSYAGGNKKPASLCIEKYN